MPLYFYPNGAMTCDDSESATNCGPRDGPGWAECATRGMIQIPSQGPSAPTVTDMHNKPCLTPCTDTSPSPSDNTAAARDTFNAVWDFLTYRNLTGNLVMFGETWSHTNTNCNGTQGDASLTQWMLSGYLQSSLCLYSPGTGCTASVSPTVVFRPWGNATVQGPVCETPLPIGAGTGSFRQ